MGVCVSVFAGAGPSPLTCPDGRGLRCQKCRPQQLCPHHRCHASADAGFPGSCQSGDPDGEEKIVNNSNTHPIISHDTHGDKKTVIKI